MDRMAVLVASLLRWSIVLLPARRRGWAEAVWAEAAEVPAGRARLSWLIGGLLLISREAGMVRRVGFAMAGVAAGVLLVWWDWHPGSANPAMPVNRATMIGVGLLLVVLPWVSRALLGPTADNRAARIVRVGGYLTVYALLLVMAGLSRFAGSRFDHFQAFDQHNWEADMRSGAVVSAVLITLVVGGYAAAVLTLTARRTSVAPTTLAAGACLGLTAAVIVYALEPLGNPRHTNWIVSAGSGTVSVAVLAGALLAAGAFAGRGIADSPATTPEVKESARVRAGVIAGLCAGGAVALLLNVLTITTMLLFPRHVDLKWANPSPAVPHGTTFEVQMSVGDAAIKYQAGLLLGPLLGGVLGAIGGVGAMGSDKPRSSRRRRMEPDVATKP
jgi:hypothetical protein